MPSPSGDAMSTSEAPIELTTGSGYRHEALIYAGASDFLDATLDFIGAGLTNREPMLVVLDEDKIDALRRELGRDADAVTFADMTDVGANPGRIIGLWHAFLADNARAGAVRGIGEPVYAERSPAELIECQLHEALLNVAFPDVDEFWLLCPYDLESLPDEVVAEAFRSHPFIVNGGDRRPSPLYRHPDPAVLFGSDLPGPGGGAVSAAFGHHDLAALRRFVAERAALALFHTAQIEEIVVAVNEVATNAVEHGGGSGIVRLWTHDDTFYFEVVDTGRFDQPLAGRIPPAPTRPDGRGLWMANQLCDLVQIRSYPSGTVVRGQVRRIGSADAH